MTKCNRTVCPNVGLHKHSHNGKEYCSDCVYHITKPPFVHGIRLFAITADEAWRLRRDDNLEGNYNDRVRGDRT